MTNVVLVTMMLTTLATAGVAQSAMDTQGQALRAEADLLHQRLRGVAVSAGALGSRGAALGRSLSHLQSLGHGAARAERGRQLRTTAPAAWDDQDPADSAYRAARSALNRSNFRQAAYLFGQVREKYPKSSYAADAYYFEAFALYRQGNTDGLKRALELLERQEEKYKRADTRDDAVELRARIDAELARRGDEDALVKVRAVAGSAAKGPGSSKGAGVSISGRAGRGSREADCDDDGDEKAAALDALLSMDGDRAMPILKKVMARRDAGSICLRRKAVFLISQHQGAESEAMLLAAASSDPDQEVRENSVFWLGQSGGANAVVALDSILRRSNDDEIRDKAIFALSQHSSPRANEILRDFAQREGGPLELRENAIFWLGQSNRAENSGFLRTIYKSTKEKELKDKIIFALAQGGRKDDGRWLVEIVTDGAEDVETRKTALFWLGQSSSPLAELFTLYDRLDDRELRDQMIFVYSQRKERAAVDKLIELAKSDKDREIRKKALFWLSQSKDPRVAGILEDILSKP